MTLGAGPRRRGVAAGADRAGRGEETFFDLIDDAFNANPASMAAALDVLIAATPTDGIGRVGGGRRIAILGDMLELGPTETALHAAIAAHPGLAECR
jgi:UDP-N-acetylmuramoyl-tripeptide--D-alanyl-D-alanine ligase